MAFEFIWHIIQLNRKMSYNYVTEQHNLTPSLYFVHIQIQPLSSPPILFFVQQERPFISSFNPSPELQQISQQQTPRIAERSANPETSRSSFSGETIQRRKLKRTLSRNVDKQLESAKKNSESNLMNQLFSFFSSLQKSETAVEKAIKALGKENSQLEKIKSVFYNTVRLMNYKRGRRYVNRQTLLNYYTPQGFLRHLPDITEKLAQTGILSLQELCLVFRISTYYFIKCVSPLAILSSKRISTISKIAHLERRRLVLDCLKGNLQ